MLIKDGDTVKEGALRRPHDGEKVWIDVSGDGASSLANVFHVLGFSPDVLTAVEPEPDRAQLQYFGSITVLSLFVPEGQVMKTFTVVLAPSALVSIHREPIQLLTDLGREVLTKAGLMESAHYLLYEILERVADIFLERMDTHEETFDGLEEDVLDGLDRAHEVFALRHELHHLRGILADMRRIAARLSRRPFTSTQTGASDANIFVDVYDGFYHVMDNIDSLRDNLTGLVDLGLNQRSTRLNEIMKFLTIFSTIFLPLTFITGFFGMNLKSMPELATPHGQALTMLLMAVVAATMLIVFKRRKWM